VIGSREFVDAVFEASRDRFGPKRLETIGYFDYKVIIK
jgi:hypothetical protein